MYDGLVCTVIMKQTYESWRNEMHFAISRVAYKIYPLPTLK